ncbi:MAG: 1-deoxy-D-xylulose-5-phosphate synthase [Kiritimatiellaeota bacterium]|nr:1-deoxy-D-xylulose-5-phosphate synthase [Kiritimatiellota bacterium]
MSNTPLLDRVRSPADLRGMSLDELGDLASEIRAELLRLVGRHGGHLAPNLGVVELTIALLRVFDPPTDTIILDTGHQGYVYKLLTGRRQLMESLRCDDGCCGFLHRRESPYDAFGAGHAGTAISAALGFAAARDRRDEPDRKVVAVVGDGAAGCGVAFEGLNSIIETTADFILILNDNRMSIAPNVGALSKYLTRIISGGLYNRFKRKLRSFVLRIPRVGPSLRRVIHRVEEVVKGLLLPPTLFEKLGLRYIGPLDGHDLASLIHTFEAVHELRQPLVIHVITRKGQGYPPAEASPEDYHGISAGTCVVGKATRAPGDENGAAPMGTFSEAFGEALARRMARDAKVLAITAGMCSGTGLRGIRQQRPERLFDVGIAEEHAAVFAAGLAAAGFLPVVAIYATFMQRAVDYVFHDVCLQELPVVFCLDRAGIVPDGPTHHGIQDIGMWRSLPNLAVLQPADGPELKQMLNLLLDRGAPAILRYPKASATPLAVPRRAPLEWGRAEVLREGTDVSIWALGRESVSALEVADRLEAVGVKARVVNARFIDPLDVDLLENCARAGPVVTLEDHCVRGGLGTALAEAAAGSFPLNLLRRGWPPRVVLWGTVAGIRRRYGLQPDRLAEDITAFLRSGTRPPHGR